MISVRNISNFTLRELLVVPNRNNVLVLMVKPEKIWLPEFKSGEVVHQIVYLSDFNKDNYFIPLEVKFITESSSRK